MEWNGMCICVWRFKCTRQTNVKCENNASTQRIFSCPSIFLELIPMIFWIILVFLLVVVCNHSNRWHSVNYSELIVCLISWSLRWWKYQIEMFLVFLFIRFYIRWKILSKNRLEYFKYSNNSMHIHKTN